MLIVSTYLCVSIDAMKGMSGRMDFSSSKEGNMLSPFEDELNIVGEGVIDDGKEEGHVENPLH